MALIQGTIVKYVLINGLTIIVNSVYNIPKVSLEVWYHVGSKDEKTGEKGMAHLIEHMIFKGTNVLSESDINVITHKLSGYTNAFTSHDVTGYTYEFPTQHWKEGMALLSDCMRNARFDEQMLNSELKAVVQELKMHKDKYVSMVIEDLISAMFHDHPYHYPIIGFKQDLWNLSRQTLVDFYKKHYVPNNATLVVVGDVSPEEVFQEAQKMFGHIPADKNYKREEFYHSKDLASKSVTLYRDVQLPAVVMAANLPGGKEKRQYVFEILSWIFGSGSSSRLTKKLVDDLELVTDFQTFIYEMEDASPFFFYFTPQDPKDIEKIKGIINDEIAEVINKGLTKKELAQAVRNVRTSFLDTLESNSKRAAAIGQGYLFTGDEKFILNFLNYPSDNLDKEVREILSLYFSPTMMHWGQVLPLPEAEKKQWTALQEISDTEDSRILDGKVRTSEVEPAKHAQSVLAKKHKKFDFHKPKKTVLSNGIKVFVHNSNELPKIDIIISLKATEEYDPIDQQGLYAFVCAMLGEGTKNYPGKKLVDELQEYGMGLSIEPGRVRLSLLSEDFEKGLSLLKEIFTHATFDKKAIEKIRSRFLTDIKFFWDDAGSIAQLLVKEKIYAGHPYSKNSLGTVESISKITQKDLKKLYHDYFSPDGARIAIVGDVHAYDVHKELEKHFGNWKTIPVDDIEYPALKQLVPEEVTYKINRDQVVLAFARPSITRFDKDYDKLLLFEQIFSGGSMSSRLFMLREQSGLFYTISGSMAAGADEEPGVFMVKTIVSLDKLKQAEKLIKEQIDTVVDSLTEEELNDAKNVVIADQVRNFESNKRMALVFLALDRFKFPVDYFDTRAEKISVITLGEVKKAARVFLDSKAMMAVKVGRV